MPGGRGLSSAGRQLMLLAHGLTALGLDRRRALGMYTWAALQTISRQHLAVPAGATSQEERVGRLGDRTAGWLPPPGSLVTLEELECVGVARGLDVCS
jgi:hypothetical protein